MPEYAGLLTGANTAAIDSSVFNVSVPSTRNMGDIFGDRMSNVVFETTYRYIELLQARVELYGKASYDCGECRWDSADRLPDDLTSLTFNDPKSGQNVSITVPSGRGLTEDRTTMPLRIALTKEGYEKYQAAAEAQGASVEDCSVIGVTRQGDEANTVVLRVMVSKSGSTVT